MFSKEMIKILVGASFVLDTEKTNIKHNNREMSEREKEKNSHIDFSRLSENKYLVQEDIKKTYENEFGKSQEEYNKKQKRSDRKIDNYFEHVKQSKKTKTQQELIVQIGDYELFKDSNQNRKAAVEALEFYFNEFVERNSNLKVYNAVIHDDEASPHLHINFVPVASGYKRGLEKQVSFNRALQQQSDLFKDSERPFLEWRESEVKELEGLILELGAERKKNGTNYFKDVNEYKKAMRERAIDYEQHKLSEELKNAHERNLMLSEELESVFEEKSVLESNNERLEKENKSMRDQLDYFVENVQTLYSTTKMFLGESFSEFKSWFREDIHEKGFDSEFDFIESESRKEKLQNKNKFNDFEK